MTILRSQIDPDQQITTGQTSFMKKRNEREVLDDGRVRRTRFNLPELPFRWFASALIREAPLRVRTHIGSQAAQ